MCGAAARESRIRPGRRGKRLHRTDFVAAAAANRRNTNRLVLLLLLIGAILGYLLGWSLELYTTAAMRQHGVTVWYLSPWGVRGALLLTGFGVLWIVLAFLVGDRIVLGLVGAREVGREELPQLHNVVEEMAIAAGVPKPRVYLIDTPALNALATGLDTRRSAIGVTRGLLDKLDRDELQGVIGHEMGHIVNLDMRYATAVGILVGLIALVADFAFRALYLRGAGRRFGRERSGGSGTVIALLMVLIFAALAPVFAKLVQMAVSRQREFLADATSVRLTRNPHGLISALEKLAVSAEPFRGANRATQHMFIVNPLRNFSEQASRLFATHPPIPARVRRLMNLNGD
ncbi:putative peptidase [Nitrococcus mobilis Nb-231]|uniref:Protease HtpX n=1 Tax=Nitrococcus mobilis Nb-231 TaxID=314278 RepID=A4BSG8_9GAMM|nr:putative peptidase [Nitrococcus mobilis Nb-231]